MINTFLNATDSIPSFLQREVVVPMDTVPANEFLSHQFLPLDSSNVMFNVEAFNPEVLFSGLPSLARSFMLQQGSTIFLLFTLCFVLSALVFRNSGRALVSNFGYIFTLGSPNKHLYSEQVTISDVWGHIFLIFQTLFIYAILFFTITLQQSDLFFTLNDHLVLFAQILMATSLFVFIKLGLYKMIGAIFTDSKTDVLTDVYLWIVYLSGILSFIPILAYLYIQEVKLYALILIIAVFLIGRIIVILKSYTLFAKSHIGILYFFVYLCGLEVMPYLLLYKAVTFIN